MKLTVFQSGKGDCLLLETADGAHRVLVDGGVKQAYTDHVADAVGAIRDANQTLDLVYVSHIDEDHIAGVLQLLDDEAAWRVHEHQVGHDNPGHKPPTSPRPAQVQTIFHNSFHDLIGRNSGAIHNMLAATASILSGSEDPWIMKVAQDRREIAASIPQAIQVSQRIKPGQLDIPLNPQFDGKLMMVGEQIPPIDVGSIKLKLIGPFPDDLKKLRTDWNDWLRENRKRVRTLRTQARRDHDAMTTSELDLALGPLLHASDVLGGDELALAKQLGRRSRVTAPNLASLMFLAEECDETILLTGDGHADDILKGLDHHDALDADGKLHVSVLKVQHHGSEHNIDRAFCDAITADDYIFCGNGEHENPELDVLQLIHDRRMANDAHPFTFWFNSSSTLSTNSRGSTHMEAVERLVADLATASGGRQTNTFITGSSLRVR